MCNQEEGGITQFLFFLFFFIFTTLYLVILCPVF